MLGPAAGDKDEMSVEVALMGKSAQQFHERAQRLAAEGKPGEARTAQELGDRYYREWQGGRS